MCTNYKSINLKKLYHFTVGSLIVLAQTLFSGTAYSQTSYTFNYTGSSQTISLPAGSYSIECWGADGGKGFYSSAANNRYGGKGGYSNGIITFSGTTLVNIYVGGKGQDRDGVITVASGGWNGGGNSANFVARGGGGGGGGTDIRIGGNSFANRIIVAGGAGGGIGSTSAVYNNIMSGGFGGGTVGTIGGYTQQPTANGDPGTQSAGGAYATYNDGSTQFGTPGSFGIGGNAGGASGTGGGAGGGGGYYGGGGANYTGGGGGGSGYIGGVSSGTTILFGQAGFVSNPDVTGNGRVIITQLCSITLGTSTGSNMICNGSAVTLTTNAISNYSWSTGSNASSITVSPSVTTSYSLTAMSPSLCVTSAAITITVSNAAPSLSVSVSSPTVCLGNTVSISASGALTYSFSGGISNGVAFTPTATTAYTIQGQNGCGTASAVSTITIAPLPVIGIVSPTAVCAGNTATLSGGGATTYTWQPGSIVNTSVVVSPQQNTTYTVTGETGNCIGTNTVALNVNPTPSLTVSTNNFTLCLGESTTLTASGALNYTWQPGGITGASVVVTPTIPTAYTVIGENSFGCTASVQQPVIVYPLPSLLAAANRTLVCAGGPSTLVVTGANTYSWSTGALTQTVLVTPLVTSVFTVTGTFTNSGCSTSKTVMVQVFSPLSGISGPTAVCLGSSVTLITAFPANSYTWTTGGNFLSNWLSVVISPTVTNTYSLSALSTSNNVNCVGSSSISIQVNPLPTVIAVASKTLLCKFEPTILSASGANTYMWILTGSSGSTILVTPLIQTIYTVVGTDINGCSNTATILIRVGSEPCGWTVYENSYELFPIQLYPNPSSGEFIISAEDSIDLLLINELGQIVQEIELNSGKTNSIQIQSLAKGIYFLHSKDPTRRVNKKIIVQ